MVRCPVPNKTKRFCLSFCTYCTTLPITGRFQGSFNPIGCGGVFVLWTRICGRIGRQRSVGLLGLYHLLLLVCPGLGGRKWGGWAAAVLHSLHPRLHLGVYGTAAAAAHWQRHMTIVIYHRMNGRWNLTIIIITTTTTTATRYRAGVTGVLMVTTVHEVAVALHTLHVERAVAARVDLAVKDPVAQGAVHIAGRVALHGAVVVRVIQVREGHAARTLGMVVLGVKLNMSETFLKLFFKEF